MPNLVEERERGKKVFMGRTNKFLSETQMLRNKWEIRTLVIIFPCVGKWSFHLFHDHETPPFILGLLLVSLLGVDANLK